MRKLAVGIILGVLVGFASPAMAIDFQLKSYDVDLNYDGDGLVLWKTDEMVTPFPFPLSAGESKTFGLFYIGTDENDINPDDWIPYLASVSFQFDLPTGAGGQVYGLTGGGYFGRRVGEKGYIGWDNPLAISFGSSGTLEITLSHETFDVPTELPGALVEATFRLRAPGTTHVPEPSSMALLGMGLVMATRFRRRLSA